MHQRSSAVPRSQGLKGPLTADTRGYTQDRGIRLDSLVLTVLLAVPGFSNLTPKKGCNGFICVHLRSSAVPKLLASELHYSSSSKGDTSPADRFFVAVL